MDRKLTKNAVLNIINQILLLVVPFITTPYVSRVFGADRIGEYSFAQSVTSVFSMFAILGSGLYGQRMIAVCKDNTAERNKNFTELFLLRFIFTGIMLVIYYSLIYTAEDNKLLYLIVSIEIICVSADISWFYQGIEEFGVVTVCNAISKVVGVLLIFTLVHEENDIFLYVGIQSASLLLGYVVLWFFTYKNAVRLELKGLCLRKHIYPMIRLFLSQIAIQIYTVLDRVMIGVMSESYFESGYYAQSQKIIKMVLAVVTSVGTVMASRIAFMWKKGKSREVYGLIINVFQVIMCITLPMTMGLIVSAPIVVPVYFGAGYEPVVRLIQILAWLFPIIGCSNIIGMQLLYPTGRENMMTVSVIIGAVVNVIANFCLIPKYGAVGAAVGSILAEISVSTVQLFMVRRELNICKLGRIFFRYSIFSIIVGILAMSVCNMLSESIGSLFIIVILYMVVYGALLAAFRDPVFEIVKKRIKNSEQ